MSFLHGALLEAQVIRRRAHANLQNHQAIRESFPRLYLATIYHTLLRKFIRDKLKVLLNVMKKEIYKFLEELSCLAIDSKSRNSS